MTDYLNMDISSLTVDDALHDDEWGKRPIDICRFVSIDVAVLDSFADFTHEEIAEIMLALRDYCIDGVEPDYKAMSTSAVKVSVRTLIAAHNERMSIEFLKKYKQFAGAKKQQAEIRLKQVTTGNL